MEILKNKGFRKHNMYYVKNNNEYYEIKSKIGEDCNPKEISEDKYEKYKTIAEKEDGVAFTKDSIHCKTEDVQKVNKKDIPLKVRNTIEKNIL